MAHAQNSPRGLFSKKRISYPASAALYFTDYSASNALLTANSTGLKIYGGVRISNQANATITGDANGIILAAGVKIANAQLITANSTAVKLPTRSTLPDTRQVGGICFVSNSTGKSIAFWSTGTTWSYPTKTSVLA